VEGVSGALAAVEGGADRIELCAGLVEGGTTPSFGILAHVLEQVSAPTVVLIRPRGGDFLYSSPEIEALLKDVELARDRGVYGIAVGVLERGGTVDRQAMKRIISSAGSLSVTFHRAFDMTRDPRQAMETLIDLGADRILTSGQARSVPEGLELIAKLVEQADERISIMPGAGIREDNIRQIVRATGVREVHFTAPSVSSSPMTHRNPQPLMGGTRIPGEYELMRTDPALVHRMVAAVR
jgi:copper homeostasis protein